VGLHSTIGYLPPVGYEFRDARDREATAYFQTVKQMGERADLRARTLEELLHKEIRRRRDVVGIFPDACGHHGLISSVLIGETKEWTEQRKHIRPKALAMVQRAGFADAAWADGTERALPEPMTAED